VRGARVLLQGGVHLLPKDLHLLLRLEATHVRVEQDDGAEAAQLRLVHPHVAHLGHELGEHAVEDVAHAGLVRRVAVDGQARRQHDAVADLDRAMRERRYQQLVPTWRSPNNAS